MYRANIKNTPSPVYTLINVQMFCPEENPRVGAGGPDEDGRGPDGRRRSAQERRRGAEEPDSLQT